MRPQSAISAAVTTITKTITVAAGLFAPGHLGELTRVVPFELADAVLEETGSRERRLGVLPSRVGIYSVLALGLFPRPGYLWVWAKLTAELDGLGLAVPSARALRDLRRRISIAPPKALFEMLAGPTRSRPCRAPTRTGPATRSPSKPPRYWSPAPATSPARPPTSRRDRPCGPGEPARPAPAPRQRPPGQISSIPLRQASAR